MDEQSSQVRVKGNIILLLVEVNLRLEGGDVDYVIGSDFRIQDMHASNVHMRLISKEQQAVGSNLAENYRAADMYSSDLDQNIREEKQQQRQ